MDRTIIELWIAQAILKLIQMEFETQVFLCRNQHRSLCEVPSSLYIVMLVLRTHYKPLHQTEVGKRLGVIRLKIQHTL